MVGFMLLLMLVVLLLNSPHTGRHFQAFSATSMALQPWQPKTLAQAVVAETIKLNLSLCCPDLAATIKQIGRSQDIINFFTACRPAGCEEAESGPQPLVAEPGPQPLVAEAEANDDDPGPQPLVAEPGQPQPAVFEQPKKPLIDSYQAAVAVHIAQTTAKIIARAGMAGNWRPGPGKRKGVGRPAAGIAAGMRPQKRKWTAGRQRHDMSADQKLALANQLAAVFAQTGCSRRMFFAKRAAELGCTATLVRKIYDNRAAW